VTWAKNKKQISIVESRGWEQLIEDGSTIGTL